MYSRQVRTKDYKALTVCCQGQTTITGKIQQGERDNKTNNQPNPSNTIEPLPFLTKISYPLKNNT